MPKSIDFRIDFGIDFLMDFGSILGANLGSIGAKRGQKRVGIGCDDLPGHPFFGSWEPKGSKIGF
jgi:hypothetical protein